LESLITNTLFFINYKIHIIHIMFSNFLNQYIIYYAKNKKKVPLYNEYINYYHIVIIINILLLLL